MPNPKIIRIALSIILAIVASESVFAQSFEVGYYRLTNKWIGDGKSLDVINDSMRDKLKLADSSANVGQAWKLVPVGDGYYRLSTKWLGTGKSLNVINDDTDDKLNLAGSENLTGQFWKITPVGDGYFRLTTKWLGDKRSLDVVNDDRKNQICLAETTDVDGQLWKLSPISGGAATDAGSGPIKTSIRPIAEFKKMTFAGFVVKVHPELVGKDVTVTALELLEKDLAKVSKLIKPEQLDQIRKVPIWLQYKLDDSGMWYHESKGWLLSQGYPAELEKSVEISDVASFVSDHDIQPFATLHELAYAYNDLYLSALREKLKSVYNNAVKSGKYDRVERVGSSGLHRHYGLTNEIEFFAELTEAFFGKNDYYPFTREELIAVDPLGYQFVREAWRAD